MSQLPSSPPPVAPPSYGYNNSRGQGYGVAALVLGIITLLFIFIPPIGIIGIVTGIIGIILGNRGRTLSPPGMAGMATAGLVCSIVGLCILLLGLLIFGGIIGLIANIGR